MMPNRVRTLAGFRLAARIMPAISGKSVPMSPKAPESSLRSKAMRARGGSAAWMGGAANCTLYGRISRSHRRRLPRETTVRGARSETGDQASRTQLFPHYGFVQEVGISQKNRREDERQQQLKARGSSGSGR